MNQFAEIDRQRIRCNLQAEHLKLQSAQIAEKTQGVIVPLRDVPPDEPVLTPASSATGLNEDAAAHIMMLNRLLKKYKRKNIRMAERLRAYEEQPDASSSCGSSSSSASTSPGMGNVPSPPPVPNTVTNYCGKSGKKGKGKWKGKGKGK